MQDSQTIEAIKRIREREAIVKFSTDDLSENFHRAKRGLLASCFTIAFIDAFDVRLSKLPIVDAPIDKLSDGDVSLVAMVIVVYFLFGFVTYFVSDIISIIHSRSIWYLRNIDDFIAGEGKAKIIATAIDVCDLVNDPRLYLNTHNGPRAPIECAKESGIMTLYAAHAALHIWMAYEKSRRWYFGWMFLRHFLFDFLFPLGVSIYVLIFILW